MLKKTLNYIILLLAIPVALFIIYVYLAFTPITSEKTIDSGSYSEFTIKMSKQEAYRKIQELYKTNKIESLFSLASKEEENIKYPEYQSIGERKSIENVKDVFDRFNTWSIFRDSKNTLIRFRFNGNRLSDITRGLDYQGDLPVGIIQGKSYIETYVQLVNFFNDHRDKNYSIRSYWFARRQISEFTDEEYKYIERDSKYTIFMKTYFSYKSTALYFDDADKLIKIVNRFQLMENP